MPGVLSVQLIKQNLVFLQNEKGLLMELLTGETGGKGGCQKASFLLSVIHSLCWRISQNYSHTTECGDTWGNLHWRNLLYTEIAAHIQNFLLGGALAKTFTTVLLVYIIVVVD